jgi:IS5 family transposase
MVKKSSGSAAEEVKGQTAGVYRKLIYTTGRVIKQAQRIVVAAAKAVRATRSVKHRLVEKLIRRVRNIVHLTQKVIRQSKARIFQGDTHFKDKIVSLAEPSTEIIRKGKTAKPTEFGRMVKIQEAENQIITDYAVYPSRPQDADLLISSIEHHKHSLGCPPDLVTADAAFYTSTNQKEAEKLGVTKFGVPNCRTRDPEKRLHHKQRWFRKSQRWRVGCEGRISVIKRRHGLSRSLYKGYYGMQRWVGWGVVANNLIRLKEIALTG